MGARVNFIFDDGSDALVGLYSHWGADTWITDLEGAFAHADVRKGDHSYWTRMVISYLIQDEVMKETGYGIFAITRDQLKDFTGFLEEVVVIDVKNASLMYSMYSVV